MWRRERHRAIAGILDTLDAAFLSDCACYFAGGTAIALLLDEFRVSEDIGFLCSDVNGYRRLRERVSSHGLGGLGAGVPVVREARMDQYGIRGVLGTTAAPIKFEIVREGRIELEAGDDVLREVRILSRRDLYTEKLLANADRGFDRSTLHRDLIDLCVMVDQWHGLPREALERARRVYGKAIDESFVRVGALLVEPRMLAGCLEGLGAGPMVRESVERVLSATSSGLDAVAS